MCFLSPCDWRFKRYRLKTMRKCTVFMIIVMLKIMTCHIYILSRFFPFSFMQTESWSQYFFQTSFLVKEPRFSLKHQTTEQQQCKIPSFLCRDFPRQCCRGFFLTRIWLFPNLVRDPRGTPRFLWRGDKPDFVQGHTHGNAPTHALTDTCVE